MNIGSKHTVIASKNKTHRPTRMRWLIVWLVFLLYTLMFIDRVNISVAAKYIMPEFGITQVQMGWIFSAFVLGYAVMQVPGGWLGDRFGSTRILTWAIVWWSAFTALTAIAGHAILASTFGIIGSFVLIRALIGVGEAAAMPNGSRIVGKWVAPEERGLALGFTLSGVATGAAVAPPLVAWIMVTWGWREAFYVAGAVGVVMALVWYLLASDEPATNRWLDASRHRQRTSGSSSPGVQRGPVAPVPWRSICGRADLWCLTIAYFACGYVMYIYFSWLFIYLVNVRGFSILQGGFYTAAPFVACGITAPLGGWLTDGLTRRFGKRVGRCGPGIVCLPLTGIFIVLGSAATNPHLAVLFLSLGSGVLYIGVASYWAAAIDLSNHHSGTVCGFMNTGANSGGVLSPVLTPFLAERFGWDFALYVAAGVAFVGAAFWLWVHPERPLDLQPSEQSRLPGTATSSI